MGEPRLAWPRAGCFAIRSLKSPHTYFPTQASDKMQTTGTMQSAFTQRLAQRSTVRGAELRTRAPGAVAQPRRVRRAAVAAQKQARTSHKRMDWLRLIDDCVGELGCATQADERSGEAAVQRLPAAALAALAAWSMAGADVARAAEFYTPPPPPSGQQSTQQKSQTLDFPTTAAPAVKSGEFQLPEGNQWRYSEFINAVQAGKVERVRFSKDGGQLQARLPAGPPWEATSVSPGTCFLRLLRKQQVGCQAVLTVRPCGCS